MTEKEQRRLLKKLISEDREEEVNIKEEKAKEKFKKDLGDFDGKSESLFLKSSKPSPADIPRNRKVRLTVCPATNPQSKQKLIVVDRKPVNAFAFGVYVLV